MRLAAIWALCVLACSKPAEHRAAPGPGVIFHDQSGREITAADLANVTGSVDWNVVGDHDVSEEAVRLHEEGRAAGARGDYPNALALLAKAHAAAPRWPYPLYDTAYTYELMDEPAKALEAYEQTLALAPRGFFTAMTSADCLRREAAREWTAGICKRYAMAEFMDPATKKTELEAIVAVAPGVPAAWNDLASALDDDGAKLTALDRALAHGPDPETRGFALANKALVLDRAGKHGDAVRILGELALDPKSPLDVAELAKFSLAQITAPRAAAP